MKHKNSLAFRLTVMVLVLLLVTIGAMMFLTKFQMDAHFSQYLYNSSHMMGQARGMHGMMHGPAETVYLSSVHSSLFLAGLWHGPVKCLDLLSHGAGSPASS